MPNKPTELGDDAAVSMALPAILSDDPTPRLMHLLFDEENPNSETKARAFVGRLRKEDSSGILRRFLQVAFAKSETVPALGSFRRYLGQQWALATYKDSELPVLKALNQAQQILKKADDPDAILELIQNLGPRALANLQPDRVPSDFSLATLQESALLARDPETLGLAGAIAKRRWQATRDAGALNQSFRYYAAGFELALAKRRFAEPDSPERGQAEDDTLFNGINAAFVADLIRTDDPTRADMRDVARTVRQTIIDVIDEKTTPPRDWWTWTTRGEAEFGLEQFAAARESFVQAVAGPHDRWQLDTTTRQVSTLACILGYGDPSVPPDKQQGMRDAIRVLLTADSGSETTQNEREIDALVESALRGKLGLAFSGGGFRASLFHIGVLARLAEIDALRQVEVLSCVSGGSVIGAYYYLLLQNLLESKSDAEITKEDFIQIVKTIERDFVAATQTNPRTRAAVNWFKDLKMLRDPHYSRTERVSELLDEEFYNKIPRPNSQSGRTGSRYMSDLLIHPKGDANFRRPREDNWRRRAKVPILVINATTMNTCHQWQFTGSFMGEPPDAEVNLSDGNPRLRRMYYSEAPDLYKDFRLARAVSASAAVPGVFEPIALPDLYPIEGEPSDISSPERKAMGLMLSDGGVYDNQGSGSLLEQDCTVIIVSDASGHQGSEESLGGGVLNTALRSSTVSLSRVREAQIRELEARATSGLIRNMSFLHLRKDLDPPDRRWFGPLDAVATFDRTQQTRADTEATTSYGVLKTTQNAISRIRTDLDSFHDVEAYALMASGYEMAKHDFANLSKELPNQEKAEPVEWNFLALRDAIQGRADREVSDRVNRLLAASSKTALKYYDLAPKWVGYVSVAAIFLAIALPFWLWPNVTWRIHLAAIVISVILAFWRGKGKRKLDAVIDGLFAFFILSIGWILAWFHLKTIDRLYLDKGRVPMAKGKS